MANTTFWIVRVFPAGGKPFDYTSFQAFDADGEDARQKAMRKAQIILSENGLVWKGNRLYRVDSVEVRREP